MTPRAAEWGGALVFHGDRLSVGEHQTVLRVAGGEAAEQCEGATELDAEK